MCINGEEQVETCADARQEVCKNGVITGVPFQETGEIIEAKCVPNNWEPCVTECNTLGELENAEEDQMKSAARKDYACCKKYTSNCYWIWYDKDETVGRCYPLVPPGGKFWAGPSSSIQKEPSCDIATTDYKIPWQEAVKWSGKYECTKNCEVYTDDALYLFSNYCNSIGDCGAQYNYQGVWTYDGLYRAYEKEEDVDKDYEVQRTIEDPNKFEELTWKNRLNIGEGAIAYKIGWDTVEKLGQETGVKDELWGISGGIVGGAVGLAALASLFFTFAGGMVTTAGIGAGGVATGVETSWMLAGAGGMGAKAAVTSVGTVAGWIFIAAGAGMLAYGFFAGSRQMAIMGAVSITAGIASLAIAACMASCWTGYGALAAAAVVVVAWILVLGADKEDRAVTVQCAPWQPPTKGYDCESCDADPMKQCSEYRCKAIGQNCAFIPENEGTNRGTCYNANPDDVNSPRITDRSAIITSHKQDISQNFQLVPTETTTQVTGFKITPNVPPYSRVTVGIKTNEMSQCKIGQELPQGKAPYGVLPNYMPDSYYDMQHNYTIAGIVPEKEYHYYISCQDPSGNSQATVYGISFTADQGNDITPPQITGASLKDNAYVAAGVNETLLAIYVDEQSRLECKWSREDKDFNFMENNMSCASVPLEATSPRPAECGASMQLYEKNSRYYFRCRDYPMEYAGGAPTGNVLSPNVMQQSFSLNLQKSDALILQQTAPSGRLYTNNVTMQARTQQGAEAGKAVCYYNDIMFANTNSSYHEQTLSNLPTNDYKYSIECVDIAGNIAEGNISFSIDVDTAAPSIIGIHKSGNELKIITDEPTKCQYSNSSFSYGMGTAMLPDNSAEHSTSAAMPKYHIVCADMFNNRMPEVKIVLFESIS